MPCPLQPQSPRFPLPGDLLRIRPALEGGEGLPSHPPSPCIKRRKGEEVGHGQQSLQARLKKGSEAWPFEEQVGGIGWCRAGARPSTTPTGPDSVSLNKSLLFSGPVTWVPLTSAFLVLVVLGEVSEGMEVFQRVVFTQKGFLQEYGAKAGRPGGISHVLGTGLPHSEVARPQGALAAIALDAVWGHMRKLQYGRWRVL